MEGKGFRQTSSPGSPYTGLPVVEKGTLKPVNCQHTYMENPVKKYQRKTCCRKVDLKRLFGTYTVNVLYFAYMISGGNYF